MSCHESPFDVPGAEEAFESEPLMPLHELRVSLQVPQHISRWRDDFISICRRRRRRRCLLDAAAVKEPPFFMHGDYWHWRRYDAPSSGSVRLFA